MITMILLVILIVMLNFYTTSPLINNLQFLKKKKSSTIQSHPGHKQLCSFWVGLGYKSCFIIVAIKGWFENNIRNYSFKFCRQLYTYEGYTVNGSRKQKNRRKSEDNLYHVYFQILQIQILIAVFLYKNR